MQTNLLTEATRAGPDPDLGCTAKNNSLRPQVSSEAQDKTNTQESSPQCPSLCLHHACTQKKVGVSSWDFFICIYVHITYTTHLLLVHFYFRWLN